MWMHKHMLTHVQADSVTCALAQLCAHMQCVHILQNTQTEPSNNIGYQQVIPYMPFG